MRLPDDPDRAPSRALRRVDDLEPVDLPAPESVFMPEPLVERLGPNYYVTWPESDELVRPVRLYVSNVLNDRRTFTVSADWQVWRGNQWRSLWQLTPRLNLWAAASVKSHKRDCAERYSDQNWDWDIAVDAGLGAVEHAHREGDPAVQFTGGEGAPTARVPWLIDGFVYARQYNMLLADPQNAKTTFAMFQALAVTSGQRFLGSYPVRDPGPVCWWDWENDRQSTETLWNLCRRGLGLEKTDIPHPFDYKRFDRPIMDVFDELLSRVNKVRPKLIVVDSIYGASGEADTNDPAVGNAIMAALRPFDCAVQWLHHRAKAARKGRDDVSTPAGAGAFEQRSRNIFFLSLKGIELTALRTKNNFGRKFDRYNFTFDWRDDLTSLTVGKPAEMEGEPTTTAPDEADALGARVNAWFVKTGGWALASEVALALGVKADTVYRTCAREYQGGIMQKSPPGPNRQLHWALAGELPFDKWLAAVEPCSICKAPRIPEAYSEAAEPVCKACAAGAQRSLPATGSDGSDGSDRA